MGTRWSQSPHSWVTGRSSLIHPFNPVGDPALNPWSIDSAGLGTVDRHELGPYRGGFVDDLEGEDTGNAPDDSTPRASVRLVWQRVGAYMVATFTRASYTFEDNTDWRKSSRASCGQEITHRTEREINLWVQV